MVCVSSLVSPLHYVVMMCVNVWGLQRRQRSNKFVVLSHLVSALILVGDRHRHTIDARSKLINGSTTTAVEIIWKTHAPPQSAQISRQGALEAGSFLFHLTLCSLAVDRFAKPGQKYIGRREITLGDILGDISTFRSIPAPMLPRQYLPFPF